MVNPTLEEFSVSCSDAFERQLRLLVRNNFISEYNLIHSFPSEFSKLQVKMFMSHRDVQDLKFLFDNDNKNYYINLSWYLICIVQHYRDEERAINNHTGDFIINDIKRMMLVL